MTFVKINTEEQQELAAYFQIRSIPTLMAFREKIIVFSQPGMLPESALGQLISQVDEYKLGSIIFEQETGNVVFLRASDGVELDMDEVRREIAEQETNDKAAAGQPSGA